MYIQNDLSILYTHNYRGTFAFEYIQINDLQNDNLFMLKALTNLWVTKRTFWICKEKIHKK